LENKVKIDVITLEDHKKKAKNASPVQEANAKMPKWKRESEQFRNAMKRAKDPDAVDIPEIDERIPCKFCNRKFAELTYEKHVVYCKAKNDKKMKK